MFAPLVQSLALILVETFKTKNNPNPKVSTLRSYMYVTLVVVVVVFFFKKRLILYSSSHQLNCKNNGPVVLDKTILRD